MTISHRLECLCERQQRNSSTTLVKSIFVVLTHLKIILLYLSHFSLMAAQLKAKRYFWLRFSKQRRGVWGACRWATGFPSCGRCYQSGLLLYYPIENIKVSHTGYMMGYRKRKAVKAPKGHQRGVPYSPLYELHQETYIQATENILSLDSPNWLMRDSNSSCTLPIHHLTTCNYIPCT